MDNSNSDFLPMLSISKEKALKNLEEAKNYIIIDLKNIASILSSYHPLEIARMSIWESRKVERKSKDSFTRSTYRLLPILIQSVLVSDLFFASSNNRDVKNKDWQRVLSLAEDVARKLSRYIDNLTIVHLNDGLVSREDIIDYRAGLYEQYFPSEKTHDIIRRERALALASFEWDESAVEETFSVSPERLVKDLYDISDKALDVIDNLVSDVSAFKDTKTETTALFPNGTGISGHISFPPCPKTQETRDLFLPPGCRLFTYVAKVTSFRRRQAEE